jgi:hypothetical protein
MPNRFGAMPIPAAPVGDQGREAVTDPGLDAVLSFCTAVLLSDLQDAYASVNPGRGSVVEHVEAVDPAVRGLPPDAKLPALFGYRTGTRSPDQVAIDYLHQTSTIRLWWVFAPRADALFQARARALVNGVAKVLGRAIAAGRHRAWVVESDGEAPGSLLLPRATLLAPATYTVAHFNGPLAGAELTPRALSITTTPALGAYNTTDPIVVTGTIADGRVHVEEVYLTDADGGETIPGIWPFATITSIAVPAQLATTGAISAGFVEAEAAARGSLLHQVTRMESLRLQSVTLRDLPIEIKMETVKERNDVPAIELELEVVERFDFDLSADPPGEGFDAIEDATGGVGASIDITDPNGDSLELADLPA